MPWRFEIVYAGILFYIDYEYGIVITQTNRNYPSCDLIWIKQIVWVGMRWFTAESMCWSYFRPHSSKLTGKSKYNLKMTETTHNYYRLFTPYGYFGAVWVGICSTYMHYRLMQENKCTPQILRRSWIWFSKRPCYPSLPVSQEYMEKTNRVGFWSYLRRWLSLIYRRIWIWRQNDRNMKTCIISHLAALWETIYRMQT